MGALYTREQWSEIRRLVTRDVPRGKRKDFLRIIYITIDFWAVDIADHQKLIKLDRRAAARKLKTINKHLVSLSTELSEQKTYLGRLFQKIVRDGDSEYEGGWSKFISTMKAISSVVEAAEVSLLSVQWRRSRTTSKSKSITARDHTIIETIVWLAFEWGQATGRKPTLSNRAKAEGGTQPGGKFFEFVNAVIGPIVKDTQQRKSLAAKVSTALYDEAYNFPI